MIGGKTVTDFEGHMKKKAQRSARALLGIEAQGDLQYQAITQVATGTAPHEVETGTTTDTTTIMTGMKTVRTVIGLKAATTTGLAIGGLNRGSAESITMI